MNCFICTCNTFTEKDSAVEAFYGSCRYGGGRFIVTQPDRVSTEWQTLVHEERSSTWWWPGAFPFPVVGMQQMPFYLCTSPHHKQTRWSSFVVVEIFAVCRLGRLLRVTLWPSNHHHRPFLPPLFTCSPPIHPLIHSFVRDLP